MHTLKHLKVGELGGKQVRKRKYGDCDTNAAWNSLSLRRGEESDYSEHTLQHLEEREVETSLTEWSGYIVAKSSNGVRDLAQTYGSSGLAATITRQKTKSLEPDHFPSPSLTLIHPELRAGLLSPS